MSQNKPVGEWLDRQKALLNIVGARLTSVQFILNYLILGFDERGTYTTLIWPELSSDGKQFSFGMQDYRNQPCGLTEHTVVSAEIDQQETISIRFDNGAEMQIKLRSYQHGGERGILTGPKNFLFVF